RPCPPNHIPTAGCPHDSPRLASRDMPVLRPRSRALVDGPARAGARSMMRAVGYKDEDFHRPLVGVAHSWIEIMPCNFNHRQLAEWVKEGIREAGGTPVEFNTIAVSDGIAMGTEGM